MNSSPHAHYISRSELSELQEQEGLLSGHYCPSRGTLQEVWRKAHLKSVVIYNLLFHYLPFKKKHLNTTSTNIHFKTKSNEDIWNMQ